MEHRTHKHYVMVIALSLVGIVLLLAAFARFYQNSGGVENTQTSYGTPVDLQSIKGPAVLAEGLEVPWDVVFLPDGRLLVTERPGRLRVLDPDGTLHTLALPVADTRAVGEAGLLGLTLHPGFDRNNLLYLYRTYARGSRLINRVERYVLQGTELALDQVIVDDIPGARNHNGGRIAFGPDGYLYIATGDAGEPRLAQDTGSLAGKVLRVTDEGAVPEDNPFGNAVYSYGHRNPQGLTWDAEGRLWSTEHGRSGARSGLDEVNRIVRGGNYGWPASEGDHVAPGTTGPAVHSGANTTWAPSGAAYAHGSIFFAGLRGEALYEAVLDGDQVREIRVHLKGQYGRIRAARAGPNEELYITTSNRDGRGTLRPGDDRIIRIELDQSAVKRP